MGDVALVCGGGGALGSALVRTLLERGDRVVAADLHPDDSPAPDGLRRDVVDLTSAGEVDALWERLKSADDRPRWVVNAAGGFRPGTVADSEPEQLRFVADLNLGTAWWSCRAAARRLPDGGAIVNVASRTALTGGAGAAAYAVAKAGVVRLTEVLAAELARAPRAGQRDPAVGDRHAGEPRDDVAGAASQRRRAGRDRRGRQLPAERCGRAVTGAIVPVYGWA